jgi:transcriptional regulator with XRE-family HTH domain
MLKTKKYELFQKALFDARVASNLTQYEIASTLNKPQSFVSKYESGERRLDVIEFMEVCKAIRVDPINILRELGNKNGDN